MSFLLPPLAWADTVYFTSGEALKGLVVEEHQDRVVVSTEEGEKPILRGGIEEIFYDDPERNYLYLGNQALESGDTSLARGLFKKALQFHAGFQEAQDALQRLEDILRKLEAPTREADFLKGVEKQWGLTLEPTEDLSRVVQVREGSLAERSGIAPSDRPVALWDFSLAYLPLNRVAEELLGPAGSRVKLTIERQIQLPRAPLGGWAWPQMKLSMERLGLTVLTVGTGGAAARAGLRPQDRIVKLEGASTRYLPLAKAREKIQQARNQAVRLTIHRDLEVVRE